VVSQLELCWNLAIDEGETLLELNGDVGGGGWIGCGTGRVGGVPNGHDPYRNVTARLLLMKP